MNLITEKLEAEGFNPNEIRTIRAHCDAAEKAGTFSRAAALVQLAGEPEFGCRTIAEILDQLRPGCWLDRSDKVPSPPRHVRRKSKREIAAIREFAEASDDGNLIKIHYTYPDRDPAGLEGEF